MNSSHRRSWLYTPLLVLTAACISTASFANSLATQESGEESTESKAEAPKKVEADSSNPEEIVIEGSIADKLQEPTELTQKLLEVPVVFGDPFTTVFSLPGVVEETEGDGEPAVRGTGPEDNEFLIDFLPTSYVFHPLGVSIFSEHLIRDFGINAAGFGPEYDQAIGAIFDVSLRAPRQEKFKTTIDLSFLRVGILFEGQVAENHSLFFSGRESLIHLLIEAVEEEEDSDDDEGIRFNRPPVWNDYQLKYAWTPDENNIVTVLVNSADDGIAITFEEDSEVSLTDPGFTGRTSFDTRFNSQGMVWDRYTEKSRLRVGTGRLDEELLGVLNAGAERFFLKTVTFTSKFDYQYLFSDAHTLRVGAQLQQYDYTIDFDFRFQPCTDFDPDCDRFGDDQLAFKRTQKINQQAFFLEYEWKNDFLSIKPGVRYTNDDYLDENFAEPRLHLAYQVNERVSLFAKYGLYHQLPLIEEIMPEIGNPALDSPTASHLVFGTKLAIGEFWDLSLELYRKNLRKLVINIDEDRNYVNGVRGRASGIEIFLERKATSNWFGWFTLSYTESERFDTLNDRSFNSENDTPLVVNFVFNYKTNGKWTYGLRWNLRSGAPYTPIIGNEPIPNNPGFYRPVFGELNSARASFYHRLDFRAERTINWGKVTGSLYFDIINLYGSDNTGSVEYIPIENSNEFMLENEPGLPLLPSIGLTLHF